MLRVALFDDFLGERAHGEIPPSVPVVVNTRIQLAARKVEVELRKGAEADGENPVGIRLYGNHVGEQAGVEKYFAVIVAAHYVDGAFGSVV